MYNMYYGVDTHKTDKIIAELLKTGDISKKDVQTIREMHKDFFETWIGLTDIELREAYVEYLIKSRKIYLDPSSVPITSYTMKVK